MKNKSYGFAQTLRFVWRHILRNGFKTVLLLILAAIFVIGLASVNLAIINNEKSLDELYNTIAVDLEIVKSNSSMDLSGGGYIYQTTIDQILETGYVKSYFAQGNISLYSIRYIEEENGKSTFSLEPVKNYMATTFDDLDKFIESRKYDEISVTFFDGYDKSMFETDWEYDPESYAPVIVPKYFYDMYVGNVDDKADSDEIEYGADAGYLEVAAIKGKKQLFKIAGIYDGTYGARGGLPPVMFPTSAILNWFNTLEDETLMRYSTAVFTIDPAKNRDLQALREKADEITGSPKAGVIELTYMMWDSELRMVAEPMENSIRLLKVLYPVVLAVSAIIAVGVCVLLTILSSKDAAIIRVLGISKMRCRFTLVLQMLFTCIIGLAIGILSMHLYMLYTKQINMESIFIQILQIAALYLVSTIIGTVFAAVFVTNRHPIELLQVKE